MDPLIAAASRALTAGDPLGALKRVALRDDPPALALRGIAMAQLGDLDRARGLLKAAAQGFGQRDALARARCRLAEAEIALVSRDLATPTRTLRATAATLAARGDRANAAHAGYLEARRLLLIGRLDAAEATLAGLDAGALPPASQAGCWLVAAGIAMRQIRATEARAALDHAVEAARAARIPSLAAEVARAARHLAAPAARQVGGDSPFLDLAGVEALIGSGALVIDACRSAIRHRGTSLPLTSRPVLFTLARTLAEAWPGDAARAALIATAFRGREADESHRARLRVEIGRLRRTLAPLAGIDATPDGFILKPEADDVAVITPPTDQPHGAVLALLGDGEAWSSSALALALDVSPRTVQRALEDLAATGKAEPLGRGRGRRWTVPGVPGFPTTLLLPAPAAIG